MMGVLGGLKNSNPFIQRQKAVEMVKNEKKYWRGEEAR